MAIPRERVGELYQHLKTKFIDTVDPEKLAKEEKSFDERMKDMTEHNHGHNHDHGHEHGHDHGHEHHGPAHDTETVEEHSRRLEKELEEAVSRAVYCKKVFEIQADLSRESFEAAVSENILDKSFFTDVKSVASFGCGPAPELIGFQTFLGGLPKECQPAGNLELVGYDAEEGWREFVEEIGCSFECSKINAKFIEEMPKYDIIILCYSAHHLPFNKPTEGDKTMWQMLAAKGRLLVVVDFEIHEQDETLKQENFTLLKIKEKHPMIQSFSVLGYFKLVQ